jgi:hypothetical protein
MDELEVHDINELWEFVAKRHAELGPTDQDSFEMRNSGKRRTIGALPRTPSNPKHGIGCRTTRNQTEPDDGAGS